MRDVSVTDHSTLKLALTKYRWGILYTTACSAALIVFGSPLFRTLGFEYSALSALGLSVLLPFVAAERSVGHDVLSSQLWPSLALELSVYVSLPLAISLLSSMWVPNCALWDGLAFYLEIVVLTALIGTLIGVAVGVRGGSKRGRVLRIAGIWLLSLGYGFLAGYFKAQIFSFGWQYGYFPGFVWDEAMELRDGYWLSRIEQLAAVLLLLSLISDTRRSRPARAVQMVTLIVLVWLALSWLHIDAPAADEWTYMRETRSVTIPLQYTMQVGPVCVHYPGRRFTVDQLQELRFNVGAYTQQIRSFYHLPPSERPIDIYLYANTNDLQVYVGTRNASISKPWQSTLHIARENLRSLKHELTHVMLAEYGNFPFDVSYSTGLTEGAAEAASPEYDGIRSIHELAASILAMKFATGVSDVMSFTGFASNASGKSYVLAGSFAAYLIERFGPTKYLRLYTSLDYQTEYGKSLQSLEHDWREWLTAYAPHLTPFDSLRLRLYFDRRSIVAEPCLRRIGKMMSAARTALIENRFGDADSLYASVVRESGRVDALRGRILSLMRMLRYRDALTVLDTTHAGPTDLKMAGLHLLRGDLLLLARGARDSALDEWHKAADLQLNREQVLSAGVRIFFFARSSDTDNVQILIGDLYNGDYNGQRLEALASSLSGGPEQEQFFGASKEYFLSRLEGERGVLQSELHHIEVAAQVGRGTVDLRSDDWTCVYFRLIDERYRELLKLFGNWH